MIKKKIQRMTQANNIRIVLNDMRHLCSSSLLNSEYELHCNLSIYIFQISFLYNRIKYISMMNKINK
jgi:hypothetical protein